MSRLGRIWCHGLQRRSPALAHWLGIWLAERRTQRLRSSDVAAGDRRAWQVRTNQSEDLTGKVESATSRALRRPRRHMRTPHRIPS